MNALAHEVCLAIFLLALGICCWSERHFLRLAEELDKRLFQDDYKRFKSYQALVVQKKVI